MTIDGTMRFRVCAFVAAAMCAGAATVVAARPVSVARAAITTVLTDSATAWAKGDLEGFMRSYEDSPRTTYIKGTDALRGYAAVRAIYAPRLTGPGAKPGVLTVKVDTVEPLGPNYALAIGHFRLAAAAATSGGSSGVFTLIFHKTARGWRIISDHTS